MPDMPCPRCNGDRVQCNTCEGMGRISTEKATAINVGKALRKKRRARNESLREAAKRYGLAAAELSSLERGTGGMMTWHCPWAAPMREELATILQEHTDD